MKSYKELSEDVYSSDYKYNPRTGRKTKAKRIAFNFSDADKKAEKDDKDAAADKKKEVKESTLLTFSEKMNLSKAKMGDVIKDFQDSDAPQFAGKSKEKRREMAIAAKMQADREVKEEVDLDEATNAQIHKVLGSTKNAAQGIAALKKAFKVNDAQAKAMMNRVMKEEVEQDIELTLEQIQSIRELLGEKLTAQQIKQAIGIARDKRYAGGNMTGAVKAMEKVAKGSSEHKRVQGELKKQNEEVESVEEGWDDMLKAAKERNQPKPNGGAGKKEGSRYGGSKQKDEPVKENAPVAPTLDRKYIKGTPEHKAYMATKKPINGHPTNVKEELKGGQKNLDKNKNGKLDADDFKRLRKEESEQVDEVVRVRDTIRHALDKTHGEKGPTLQHKMDRHELASAAKDRRAKTSGSGVSGFNAKIKKKDQEHRDTGHVKAVNVKEEAEQIDELSKGTLGSYIKKAADSAAITRKIGSDFEHMADKSRKPSSKAAANTLADKYKSQSRDRRKNIGKAVDRLTKEEIEQIEERNKENAMKRKSMDASRGARYKAAGNPVPDAEPEHKTGQQHNKAIGRALRNEDDESKLSYSSFMKNLTK